MIRKENIRIMQEGVNKEAGMFIALCLLSQEVRDENYEFLAMAYNRFIFNNERLIDANDRFIKREPSIKNHIWEDIRDIIIEEIFEKDNYALLGFLVEYYDERYPDVKKNLEEKGADVEQYAEYISNLVPFKTIASWAEFWQYLFGENKDIRKAMGFRYELAFPKNGFGIQMYGSDDNVLGAKLKTDDLKKSKGYQSFLSRQRKRLTEYLGIKYGDLEKIVCRDLEKTIRLSFPIEQWITGIYELLSVINYENGFAEGTLCITDIEREKRIATSVFEKLCNQLLYSACDACLLNGEEPDSEKIMCNTDMDDPKVFFMDLIMVFHIESLLFTIKELMAEACKNFSVDGLEQKNREQILAKENISLNNEVSQLNEGIEQLKAAMNEKDQKHARDLNKNRREYEKEIYSLKKELDKQKKMNDELQQKILGKKSA